jgi:3-dehydroquinate synthase
MQTFHVAIGPAGYDVFFGPALLGRVGELMLGAGLAGKVALVTSPTVASLYGQKVMDSLRSSGFEVHVLEMPDGEQHKNLGTVNSLYDAMLDLGVERSDTVVALGGGVVGDTAGFVAATYMRGLSLVQVPTTLLAQVDASIGGKVAVDHPRAKNIIGAFHQPKMVISDPHALETLPPEEFRCGLAEVVKAGMIRSPRLFAHLERTGAEPLAAIVAQAIGVKVEVVVADPYEHDLRAVLNFGHTIGHGIEAVSNYALRHGDAVSVGMVAATRIASDMGLCPHSLADRLGRLLRSFGLPVAMPGLSPDAVWQAMAADKKRRDGRLRFVLPRAIGDVVITDQVPDDLAKRVIASVVACAPTAPEI